MIDENYRYEHPTNNIVGILTGMLIGGLAGAVTMLLLAPQSGKDTRMKLREKGVELRDRTTEIVEDTMMQVRKSANEIAMGGREKFQQLKHQGQDVVIEQLDHVSEAAQSAKKAVKAS